MESPCIKVCYLNEKGFCTGCKRSTEEIANWMFYSSDERKEILGNLSKRKV